MGEIHQDAAEPIEPFYTPKEVSRRWKVGVDTARRILGGTPGVVDFTGGSRKRNASGYRLLRIPHDVLIDLERKRAIQ